MMEGVYERTLQSLVGRHTAILCIYFGILLLLLAILWGCPILYRKLKSKEIKNRKLRVALTFLFAGAKESKKDKNQKGKNKKIQTLLVQIVFTLFFIGLMMLLIVPTIKDIQLLKQDIAESSYITYEGEYTVASDYSRKVYLLDFLLDERLITLTDTEAQEMVWLDMSSIWEGWTSISGRSSGTVIYGKHSKCVIYIDGLDALWK